MTISDINSQLVPDTAFVFRLPGVTTNLKVVLNDGVTLHANIVGGPKDGLQMTWSLTGVTDIPGISLT